MIELIYNEEETSVTEEATLLEPKNIKQIGEPREYKKIFIEDFVHTYLLQYSTTKEPGTSLAILLGKSERSGGKRHLYIKSALPVEGVTEKQGKYNFTEKVWGDIYQQCEKYFPNQEIMGWFLAKPGFAVEKTAVTEETHRTYFSGAEKVLFMLEPLEGESVFFGFDGNRFAKQSGYYIYYEKNAAMREFIMEKNAGRQKMTTTEKPDVAIANFRKILQEKQEKNAKRKRMAISYSTKVAVALVLFVGAVALKNQTDKIAEMEQQMSVMAGQKETIEASSDEVVVEELPGNVEEQPEQVYEETTIHEENESDRESEETLPLTEPVVEESTDTEPEKPEEIVQQEEAEEAAEETVTTYTEYVVQEGDTLAKISRDHYGTDEKISEICILNEIQNGDYIQVGETILLP